MISRESQSTDQSTDKQSDQSPESVPQILRTRRTNELRTTNHFRKDLAVSNAQACTAKPELSANSEGRYAFGASSMVTA